MTPPSDDTLRYRGRLRQQAERIQRDSDVVLVEGRRDRAALDRLDLHCRVLCVSSRSEDTIDDSIPDHSRVTILTDYDEKGRQLNDELRELLRDRDIHHAHRRQFGRLLKQDDRYCIEDIRPLFDDPEQQFIDAALDRLYTGLS